MNITLDQFAATIPSNKNPAEWYSVLEPFFIKYELNTPRRIAAFLAQTGHESMDYRAVNENLNYSAAGLLKTFGRYYTPERAAEHARQPEKIANWVYDDRNPARKNKLGNVRDGDGWKFRGGGIKQLTGRDNYESFGETLKMIADETADYVRTPAGALESAGWFWSKNNLNRFADADDIVGLSVAINGGKIGLADRKSRYERAKSLLPSKIVLGEPALSSLKIGSKGDLVRRVQTVLNLTADGDYGKITKKAVESWQRKNRLPVTGELTSQEVSKLLGS